MIKLTQWLLVLLLLSGVGHSNNPDGQEDSIDKILSKLFQTNDVIICSKVEDLIATDSVTVTIESSNYTYALLSCHFL